MSDLDYRDIGEAIDATVLLELWPTLKEEERFSLFKGLPREEQEELFQNLSAPDQSELFLELRPFEKRLWIRLLNPDDLVDLIQELPEEEREPTLSLLDPKIRVEINALMAFEEDEAGGLMSPRYARLRPDMTVEEAIRYLRAQTRTQVEIIYYAYVLDHQMRLLGVVTLRGLFSAPPNTRIRDLMETDLITIPVDMNQEEIGRIFSQSSLIAIPVVDAEGVMQGIVTVDDIVDTLQEDATEDIQKIGGSQAFEDPYLHIGLFELVRKRAVWLLVLFFGEMFTATAMGYFEHEIERAVVLALFIPLVISSGGNSGSQASTLIIRSLALGEVRLQDWWRVLLRELSSGLMLGLVLGVIGFLRVFLFPPPGTPEGSAVLLLGLTLATSLAVTVLWGCVTGSMLPFVLRRLGLDPATASAPFVATLVDVAGLVIYFSVSISVLRGILL